MFLSHLKTAPFNHARVWSVSEQWRNKGGQREAQHQRERKTMLGFVFN